MQQVDRFQSMLLSFLRVFSAAAIHQVAVPEKQWPATNHFKPFFQKQTHGSKPASEKIGYLDQ